MSYSMLQRRLREQITQILDEGEGEIRRVIIRPTDPESEQKQKFVQALTEFYQQRGMSDNPRELLEYRKEGSLPKLQPLPSASDIFKNLEAFETSFVRSRSISSKTRHSPLLKFWTSGSMVVEMSKGDLQALLKSPEGIQSIYPNRTLTLPRVTETPIPAEAVEDERAGAWGLNRCNAFATWGAFGKRGEGVKVAVLDTGIDPHHPAFKHPNGDSKIKDWAEFDKNGQKIMSQAYDSNRHGTHCAGIIAGGNADGSWIGIAPDADLAVGLVLKGGTGTDAQILAGIEWAIELGVDVISLSLGKSTLALEVSDVYTDVLISAMSRGIPIIAAIGNDGHQTSSDPGNNALAISVGAIDYYNRPAGFSGGGTHTMEQHNFIYSKPELTAPGVAVRSAVPNAGYASLSGTSMATPHVAGAVALLLSSTSLKEMPRDSDRHALIQNLLLGSVNEMGESGQDHRYGWGSLNILRMIALAKISGF